MKKCDVRVDPYAAPALADRQAPPAELLAACHDLVHAINRVFDGDRQKSSSASRSTRLALLPGPGHLAREQRPADMAALPAPRCLAPA